MNIDLRYAEIQLMRELVTKHRLGMFKNLMKGYPSLKKKSIDELSEMQRKFNAERNPFCEEGRCGIILDKIEEIEDKVKGALTK